MIATLRLLPVLLRRAPRQAAGAAALCAAGVAVATLVAATALTAYLGLGARESRLVWREPVPAAAKEEPTLLVRRSVELFDEREIDVVEVAATGPTLRDPERAPVPPGLRALPPAGSVAVSPALAELFAQHPGDELADRFGSVHATIGEAGLAHPDELVVVATTTAGQLGAVDEDRLGLTKDERMPGAPSAVTPVARFDTSGSDGRIQMYRNVALVAVVLVAVPALMLVGSAARLTAARREQRLAAIRLAGATPGAVRALAAAETALGATVGAVVGVGSSLLLAPALHGVELAGGRWNVSDLRMPAGTALAMTAAAIAVSTAAAVFSLRRVTSGPLGVARSSEPRRAGWPRLLGVVVAFALLGLATRVAVSGGSELFMIAGLALVIASLALVGPWVTSLIGRLVTGLGRGPSTMIAGRRISDDPASAYRVVSAVVLAGMVVGFLAVVLPSADARSGLYGSTDDLMVLVASNDLEAWREQVDSLQQRFPGTEVQLPDDGALVADAAGTFELVTVRPAPGVSLEELRTATVELRRSQPLISSRDDLFSEATMVDDIRRGSLVVLLCALVLAAASSSVAAAASVVDQRRTIGRLSLAGVPVSVLQRARQWQSTVPLVTATGGAIGVGVACAVLLMLGFGGTGEDIVAPRLAQLGGIVVGAAVIGALSAAVTRPLLVAAARAAGTGERM